MKKIILLISQLALVISVTAQSFNKEKLDSLFTLIEHHNKGMGSISLFADGKEIYQRSFGYMIVEEEVPVNKDTKFRIGSISKTFTAVIIMQLIEENKLSLSSSLSEFFPEIPNADDITIEHLLRHQSGLFNFTSSPDYPGWMTDPKTRPELLEIFKKNGTVFSPGSQTQYSNTNYLLLSFIAEKIEEKGYSLILNERIIKPLNLIDTYYGAIINPVKNEAKSYKWLGEWQQSSETHMSVPVGAGAIVSNPYDLNVFYYELFKGRLVSESSLEKMKEMKDGIGLGLLYFPFYDKSAYGHNGGIDGFQSNAAYFPSENLNMAITTNGLNLSLNDLLLGVLSIYFDYEYDLPEFNASYTITGEELEKYTGVYSSENFPLKLTISSNSNTLIGQATGQPSFPLEAVDEHVFTFDAAKLEIEFIPKEDKLKLRQGGAEFTLQKEQ